MSPVPEQNPTIPAVYPRPSWMSSMYLYCARQSSEEFSALETSSLAISFMRGSVRFSRVAAPAASTTTKGTDATSVPAAARPSRLRERFTRSSSLN